MTLNELQVLLNDLAELTRARAALDGEGDCRFAGAVSCYVTIRDS